MSYNTGLTSITGNVTAIPALTVPNASQTMFCIIATGTGATQTLATVTAGKTAYVTSITGRGTANDTVFLRDNAGTNIGAIGFLANAGATLAPCTPIAVYTTGQNIKVLGLATTNITLTYFEQ